MLELLLACAPAIDAVTMSAVVKQESGGHPWVMFDNTGKRSYRFNSKDEVIIKATELISAGSSVDLGLAQINSKNLGWLGLSIESVMDPCTNIAAGAKILERGYRASGTLPGALSMYNTGKADSERGQGYAQSVYKQAGVVVPAIPGGTVVALPALTTSASAVSAVTPSPAKAVPTAAVSNGFTPRWF